VSSQPSEERDPRDDDARHLVGRPPFSDLFGVKGRAWLAELQVASEERETIDSAMRQIEFLDSEIAEVGRGRREDAECLSATRMTCW
jgi:hypothetical protein